MSYYSSTLMKRIKYWASFEDEEKTKVRLGLYFTRGMQCLSYNQDSSLSMLLCEYTFRLNQEHSGNNETFRPGFLSPNFRKKDPQISWVKLVIIHFAIHSSKNLLFFCIWGWKIWIHLYFNCYMKPACYSRYSCFWFLILPELAYAFSPVL